MNSAPEVVELRPEDRTPLIMAHQLDWGGMEAAVVVATGAAGGAPFVATSAMTPGMLMWLATTLYALALAKFQKVVAGE